MPTAKGVREWARAEITSEIVRAGATSWPTYCAAALVAARRGPRLGMVSSAVYRYVANRDELLTLLIIEAYDAPRGPPSRRRRHRRRAALRPLASSPPGRPCSRGRSSNPHQYALLYGSPVPGTRRRRTRSARRRGSRWRSSGSSPTLIASGALQTPDAARRAPRCGCGRTSRGPRGRRQRPPRRRDRGDDRGVDPAVRDGPRSSCSARPATSSSARRPVRRHAGDGGGDDRSALTTSPAGPEPSSPAELLLAQARSLAQRLLPRASATGRPWWRESVHPVRSLELAPRTSPRAGGDGPGRRRCARSRRSVRPPRGG